MCLVLFCRPRASDDIFSLAYPESVDKPAVNQNRKKITTEWKNSTEVLCSKLEKKTLVFVAGSSNVFQLPAGRNYAHVVTRHGEHCSVMCLVPDILCFLGRVRL